MACKTFVGPFTTFRSFPTSTKMKPMASRRDFLKQGSIGGLALASMLAREPLLGSGAPSSGLHHPPRAKRVIQLFMAGAASHLDMFDF